VIFVNKR